MEGGSHLLTSSSTHSPEKPSLPPGSVQICTCYLDFFFPKLPLSAASEATET